jgi:hypothetical protein
MTQARPHLCTGEGRSSARRINGKPSALGHLVSGQPQTSSQLALIAHNRPRRLATGARYAVARRSRCRDRASDPRAATSAAIGQIRSKIKRDRNGLLPHARRTRPAFLHIGAAEISSFVVSGGAREIAV